MGEQKPGKKKTKTKHRKPAQNKDEEKEKEWRNDVPDSSPLVFKVTMGHLTEECSEKPINEKTYKGTLISL